jgi:hypothetical protein
MISKIFFFFYLNISNIISLKPYQFPNGKWIKFKTNKKNLSNDLVLLEPLKASIISKNWLENIMLEVQIKRELNKDIVDINTIFDNNNLHIITHINTFENHLQDTFTEKNENEKYLYYGWFPYGNHGKKEILFIIILKLKINTNELIIQQLIQSPFWDSRNIDSIFLKKSLEHLNENMNNTILVYDYLYENNLRFNLYWNIWFKI